MTCRWHSKYMISKLETLPAGSRGAAMSLISRETLSVSKDTEPHCVLRPKEQESISQANVLLSPQIYLLNLHAEP